MVRVKYTVPGTLLVADVVSNIGQPKMDAAVAAKASDLKVSSALKGVLTSKDLEDARKAYEIVFGRVGKKEAEAIYLRILENRAALRVDGAEVASNELGRVGRLPSRGEEALIQRAFGDTVDASKITIVNGSGGSGIAAGAFKNGNPAITIGNTIYIDQGYSADLSLNANGVELLAHEVNHVRQYNRYGILGVFARVTIQANTYGADNAYRYVDRNRAFSAETLEGRSQIVGDYVKYKEFGMLPKYDVGGKSYTVPAARLEMWVKGADLYGK